MVNSKSLVFLFVGPGSYLKDRAIEDLGSSVLDRSSRQLNYKIFYGGETEAKDVLDYVNTAPFLASKRLVVIKDFEKSDQQFKNRLLDYIKKPSKSAYLVIATADDSIIKEYPGIDRYVNIRRFTDLSDSDFIAWIRQAVGAKGKKIDDDAVWVLKELQGQDLSAIDQELEKLAAFIGEREQINTEDVEEVVGRGVTSSAFDLAWAIGKGNLNEAMRIISDLILTGKKHYEIIGLLCWHLRRLLKAKTLQLKGESGSSIVGALGIKRKYAGDFLGQVRSLDIDGIRSKMGILLEADLDIKRTKYDPTLILEFAIIRLCLN